MPVVFSTESQGERPRELHGEEVPAEDLHAFFTLTGADRAAIPARSAPTNRLELASSPGAVRYLGFWQ